MKNTPSSTAIPLNIALKSQVVQLNNDIKVMLEALEGSDDGDNYDISNDIDNLNVEITFAKRRLEIFNDLEIVN